MGDLSQRGKNATGAGMDLIFFVLFSANMLNKVVTLFLDNLQSHFIT